MIDGRSIIIGIGLGLGLALAIQSATVLAQSTTPMTQSMIDEIQKLPQTFMIVGSISPTGIGRRLVIDEEGRVVCSPNGR